MKIRFDSKSHKIARRRLIRAKATAQVAWMAPDKESASTGKVNTSNRKG